MPDAASRFALGIRNPVPEARLTAVAEAMKRRAALPAPQEVAPLLQDADPRVRLIACVLLGQIGTPAVAALVMALDEKQPAGVRNFAASGLAQVGPGAAAGADALGKCLTAPDETLRLNAALALARIGTVGLPALRRGLATETSATASARGIAMLGVQGAPAAEDLTRVTGSAKAPLRLAALAALVAVTNDPARGLPQLMELARHPEPNIRAEAIERIGELRDTGRGAIPDLRMALEDPVSCVRAAAALALARVGSVEPGTGTALIRRLEDPVGEVRVHAIVALERFGPSAAAALPALRGLSGGPDKQVAAVAELAIRAIEPSPAAKPAASPAGVRR